MTIDSIRQTVAEDLLQVEKLIAEHVDSAVGLINEVKNNITKSGGKRLRPLLLLLSAKSCGYNGQSHIPLATVIELIQTATLLHDDVIDESQMRRGTKTANANWGNTVAILSGDYIYSKAFEIMLGHASLEMMRLLSQTYGIIVEGEVTQLLNIKNTSMTENEYLHIIKSKTAKLFATSAQLGAMLHGTQYATTMAEFGSNFGIAFQLIDDLLDYAGKSDQHLGKRKGDDLAEGKLTIPAIYAIQNSSTEEQKIIIDTIESKDRSQLEIVTEIMESSGAIAHTKTCVEKAIIAAKNSLNTIPDSKYKTALLQLTDYISNRSF